MMGSLVAWRDSCITCSFKRLFSMVSINSAPLLPTIRPELVAAASRHPDHERHPNLAVEHVGDRGGVVDDRARLGDRDVDREDVAHGLLQVGEDAPAHADALDDGGKVVVHQHDGGGLPCHIGAAFSHGHAHVRRAQRRGVIDAIAGHAHDVAVGLQGLHDARDVVSALDVEQVQAVLRDRRQGLGLGARAAQGVIGMGELPLNQGVQRLALGLGQGGKAHGGVDLRGCQVLPGTQAAQQRLADRLSRQGLAHQLLARARRWAGQLQVVGKAATECRVDLFDAVGDPDRGHRVGLQDLVDPGLAADRLAAVPEHLLGTDALGRDILSRLIVGAQVSLTVAVAVLASDPGQMGGTWTAAASRKIARHVVDHPLDELQPPDTHMLRLNGGLRVVPISEHIRLRDVAATVKQATVLELIRPDVESIVRVYRQRSVQTPEERVASVEELRP